MLSQKPYLTPPRSNHRSEINQDDITWVRHSSPTSERKSLFPLTIKTTPPIVREQEKNLQTYILISRWNLDRIQNYEKFFGKQTKNHDWWTNDWERERINGSLIYRWRWKDSFCSFSKYNVNDYESEECTSLSVLHEMRRVSPVIKQRQLWRKIRIPSNSDHDNRTQLIDDTKALYRPPNLEKWEMTSLRFRAKCPPYFVALNENLTMA